MMLLPQFASAHLFVSKQHLDLMTSCKSPIARMFFFPFFSDQVYPNFDRRQERQPALLRQAPVRGRGRRERGHPGVSLAIFFVVTVAATFC